ncbi:MAG: hypothetical protein OP8BY_1902 [Candidatus Saccharicenans subterraneus]|uniref:Uncharacterized protein n=1 Tax=Candidatus Saccharicenans subterraneus TaxID=2508984 RepID=A0A3E2BNK4_9BACT|nr:MAG: hypothetical protein OP8BY_1902 [Candidatus Saccharicenans subterraneum]
MIRGRSVTDNLLQLSTRAQSRREKKDSLFKIFKLGQGKIRLQT